MRRASAVAVVLLALGPACLGAQPRPTAEEGDWAAARQRALRSGKLYDGLTTNAFVTAVYQSRDLREARVARVAAWKVASPEETQRQLDTERAEAERFEDFLVFLWTPDRLDADLETLRSTWRVALVVPGEPDRLPAERGREIRVDAMLRQLYPELGDFDAVYRIRFARTTPLDGRPFTLRLAGAKGRLDFQY